MTTESDATCMFHVKVGALHLTPPIYPQWCGKPARKMEGDIVPYCDEHRRLLFGRYQIPFTFDDTK